MIVIVDYGIGNLASIANMFKKINVEACISSKPELIQSASKLLLPGVGAYDAAMENLQSTGLKSVLDHCVLEKKIPILGICLGQQILGLASEEGERPGLGWIPFKVKKFQVDPKLFKIPHMGWNTVSIKNPHPLMQDLELNRFYFVHSYHADCLDTPYCIGSTHHGYAFASVVAKDHILGAQFHPEKSHTFGMTLLRNFAALC